LEDLKVFKGCLGQFVFLGFLCQLREGLLTCVQWNKSRQ